MTHLERHAQEALDWFDVLELVSSRCTLRATQEWISHSIEGRTVHPAGSLLSKDREEALRRYQIIHELWTLFDIGEQLPVAMVRDCREEWGMIEQGGSLEESQWVRVADGFVTLQDLQRWLGQHFEEAPSLMAEIDDAMIDPLVVDTLRQSFDEAGNLSERYYPSLGRLRQKQVQIRSAIDEEVRRLMKDTQITRNLQENYVTERNGRIVFPMKNSYQKKIGIAHAASRSGETIFVEPISLLPLSNALQETEFAIEQEIRTILRQLTIMTRPHIPNIRKLFWGAVRLDLRRSLAVLTRQWKSVIPEVGTQGVVHMRNMRHPLLIDKVKVIGNDFFVDSQKPCVIFSGPNAGGKTIALKSIGVAAWMVKLGMPIPAERARIDYFEQIVADVGDAQAVEEGLSSFSAHLKLMHEVLSIAGSETLVLLDEIGMGTDPAQGAALAQAMIEQLLTQGARLVITTHFTRLKGFAYADDRCQMAAMHIQNGLPTHKLQWGEVGESEALALAERMQLPEVLIWRARNLMQTDERHLAGLIQKLEEQRHQLDLQNKDLRFQQEELQREREMWERRNRVWDERKQQMEQRFKAETKTHLQEMEQEAKRLLEQIRSGESAKKAASQLRELKGLKEGLNTDEVRPEPIDEDIVLREGDSVHVILLDALGVVRSVNGNKYEVIVNGMQMRVSREDIALPKKGGQPEKRKKSKNTRQLKEDVTTSIAQESSSTVLRTSYNTCDLRGVRVDEAFVQLEKFFDQHVLKGRKRVFVLHGHGTGALRSAVRSWLGTCQYVRDWHPATAQEGGDAFTVVDLS